MLANQNSALTRVVCIQILEFVREGFRANPTDLPSRIWLSRLSGGLIREIEVKLEVHNSHSNKPNHKKSTESMPRLCRSAYYGKRVAIACGAACPRTSHGIYQFELQGNYATARICDRHYYRSICKGGTQQSVRPGIWNTRYVAVIRAALSHDPDNSIYINGNWNICDWNEDLARNTSLKDSAEV